MSRSRSAICLVILLCTGCVKTAGIPPADLTLSSFALSSNNLFTAYFSYTVDLQNAFNDYEKSNQLTPTLICSLNRDIDFSSEHSIAIKAEGRVDASSQATPNYKFSSDLIVYYSNADGPQRDLNDYDAIKPLLASQASIPCKVRITAYGYEAYYTNTLFIPSRVMIEQIFR
ncbi:hypothetical protein EDF87_11672 [Pseudomonas helmanticensis]|uniref:Lipoprotein n=1 Tax=Pseudomonas helmanticensis TaxID=1471381 RepID=A0A4V3FQZ9_9PSED|nr:hypothetical protein [Pseudomonas helmanticensis]TDV41621.1 hypothetical protein EDF87_11672 [Pseudomonas helmanticensis]